MNKKEKDPRSLELAPEKGENKNEALARVAVSPLTKSAITIHQYSKIFGEADLMKISSCLQDSMDKLEQGNMEEAEHHLMAQAMALDSIFHSLAGKANNSEYMNSLKTFLNLALKAQSQCRATLETLAEMKNPKPYIQNNKAQYQQVNNGNADSRARGKNSKSTNELLEYKTNDEQWLDTGAAETPSRNDTEMEAVGAKHRPED